MKIQCGAIAAALDAWYMGTMREIMNGPKVRLEQVQDEEFWSEVDEVLTSYAGVVRVIGTDVEKPNMGFRAGTYGIAGEDGLFGEPMKMGLPQTMKVHPRFWSSTWFVFDNAENARHFALRFDEHVIATEDAGKGPKTGEAEQR